MSLSVGWGGKDLINFDQYNSIHVNWAQIGEREETLKILGK